MIIWSAERCCSLLNDSWSSVHLRELPLVLSLKDSSQRLAFTLENELRGLAIEHLAGGDANSYVGVRFY